ncbi:major facilitator superfamily domain-containing protein [Dichotomocladium elegans]|nr:major facilitator superfamily domain-containing protein [Dichotomocladium elegans]
MFPTRAKKLQFYGVYFGLCLSLFTIAVQATVIAPSMTKIASELDNIDNQTWIATGYLIAVISLQPLAGKFSDIFGRKPFLLGGIVFFTLGSLICALTPTMNGLIAGRAIQGFGGGAIMAMIFVIATDITPLQYRPRGASLLSGVFGLASVVGPLLGGSLVDYVSWRWDFWLFVILGGVCFVLMALLLTESNKHMKHGELMIDKLRRIDSVGTVLVTGVMCCLLLALNWGVMYGWEDAHSIGPFVAAGVAFLALCYVEIKVAKEPILPPALLRDWRIVVVYLFICSIGLAYVATLFYGPIAYQSVFGADSTQSGIRLIPYMGAFIFGAAFGGIMVQKFPYPKFFLLAGGCFSTLGYGLFNLTDEYSSWGYQAGFFAFSGLGYGLCQQNSILLVQELADEKDIAIATALISFCMLMAPAIGIAVFQALFATFLEAQFTSLPREVLIIAAKYGIPKNYFHLSLIPDPYYTIFRHAYMEAIRNMFIVPIAASSLAIILALIMPNVRWGASAASNSSTNIAKDDTEATRSMDVKHEQDD